MKNLTPVEIYRLIWSKEFLKIVSILIKFGTETKSNMLNMMQILSIKFLTPITYLGQFGPKK